MNISIIIPIYEVELYIERCLLSIMNQTFTESVECILIDDCSPDNSLIIAKKLINAYKGNIQFRIISHPYNKGIAAVRNTGVLAAKGDYIQFIDGDDYTEPDMLKELYQEAIKKQVDIVIADYWESYPNNEIYQNQVVADTPKGCLSLMADKKIKAALWFKFVKRDLYINHNLSFIEGKNYGEDFRMSFLLFYYAKSVTHIPQAFVHYIKYNSTSYSYHFSKKNQEDSVANLNDLDYLLKNMDDFEQYKSSLYKMEMDLKFKLLLYSKGELQKKWNKLYKNAYIKAFDTDLSLFWKIAFIGTYFNLLCWFNLFRKIGCIIRKNSYTIYE